MGILKAPNENCSQLWASEALNANDNDSHSAYWLNRGYAGGNGGIIYNAMHQNKI